MDQNNIKYIYALKIGRYRNIMFNSFNDAIEHLCSIVESEIKRSNSITYDEWIDNRISSNDKLRQMIIDYPNKVLPQPKLHNKYIHPKFWDGNNSIYIPFVLRGDPKRRLDEERVLITKYKLN